MLRTSDRALPCSILRISIIVTIQVFALIMLTSGPIMAQTGQDGLNNAIQEVSSYFTLGTSLMYAIGSIVGLVGAVKVYNKWNSGDQDTSKVAASWFGSCIFLIVVAAILDGFFIA